MTKRTALKSIQLQYSDNSRGNQGNNSSGRKKKNNIFGSKGVSHAIKKPKKIIVQPKKKDSKSHPIKEKTFAQLFRESLEEEKRMRKKRKKHSPNSKSDISFSDDENH